MSNSKKDDNNFFVFNQKAIKYLADIINDTNLTEIEYKCNDISIRLSKQATLAAPQQALQPTYLPNSVQNIKVNEVAETVTETYITAPIIGRVYLAPKPGDPSFIKVGDKIKEGQVICIIEAMKVMNNIKADKSGIVKEILVEDSMPVEYGQKLLILK